MSRADVLVHRPPRPAGTPASSTPGAGPLITDADVDRLAAGAVEVAVETLLRGRSRGGPDEVAALQAVARAATRRLGVHPPEPRDLAGGEDDDAPIPAVGWWSFAAQLPGVDLQSR